VLMHVSTFFIGSIDLRAVSSIRFGDPLGNIAFF
jgi:hypothetical protein